MWLAKAMICRVCENACLRRNPPSFALTEGEDVETHFSIPPLWRSGVLQLEGACSLSCGQHTPGGRPKISRSGPARE